MRLRKQVEIRDDGRQIIYYWFTKKPQDNKPKTSTGPDSRISDRQR